MTGLPAAADVVAIVSLPFTVIATFSAAVATFFAWKSVHENNRHRKQDLRFMYAGRALALYEMLKKHDDDLVDIDEQLACTPDYSVRHIKKAASLPVREMLHEAKVCNSLAIAGGHSAKVDEMARLLEVLNDLKKGYDSLQQQRAALNAGIRPGEAAIWTEAYFARKSLADDLGSRDIFRTLLRDLFSSMEDAYKVSR